MAKFLGELLFELVAALIRGWVNSFLKQLILEKAAAWLDARIHGRTTRIVVGVLLGIGAYFLIPILAGLLPL
jgi:ABC-type sugar transport system permease subunit